LNNCGAHAGARPQRAGIVQIDERKARRDEATAGGYIPEVLLVLYRNEWYSNTYLAGIPDVQSWECRQELTKYMNCLVEGPDWCLILGYLS